MPETRGPFEREVHDRLVNLESSLTAIGQQFPQMVDRQADMVGRLVRIEERLAARSDTTNARLEMTDKKLSDHEGRLRTLETRSSAAIMIERVFWVVMTGVIGGAVAWFMSP